ncbi:MAG: hypothetical protein ACNA8W_20900 [Bradymonadaceae bacterium]
MAASSEHEVVHRSTSIDYTVRLHRAPRMQWSESREAELEARNQAARQAMRVLERSLEDRQVQRCRPDRSNAMPDVMNEARRLVGDSIEEARDEAP